MSKSRWRFTFLGLILSFLLGGTIYTATNPALVSKIKAVFIRQPEVVIKPTPKAETKQPPTAVSIPKIHKNLPIQAAVVRDNDWDMYDDAVAWLSTSAVPGEGNVILYAHDRKHLWADLYLLAPGDVVEVQQNTTWKTYVVTESRAISPNDIQAILSDKNRLTMYTCEGTFDQKRRVVYADPVD